MVDGEVTTAKPAEEAAPFGERVLDLDPFVMNVGDEGYPRYLELDRPLHAGNPHADLSPLVQLGQ